jgi:hypothetical protein
MKGRPDVVRYRPPSGLNGTPRAVIEKLGTGHSPTTLHTSGVSWSVHFACGFSSCRSTAAGNRCDGPGRGNAVNDKSDFVYVRRRDAYGCPAGEYAIRRFTSIEHGMAIYKYWSSACPRCALRAKCTTSEYRRIGRWEHEQVLDKMEARLDRDPSRSEHHAIPGAHRCQRFRQPDQSMHLAAFVTDPHHVMVLAVDGDTVVGMASGIEYFHPDKALQ